MSSNLALCWFRVGAPAGINDDCYISEVGLTLGNLGFHDIHCFWIDRSSPFCDGDFFLPFCDLCAGGNLSKFEKVFMAFLQILDRPEILLPACVNYNVDRINNMYSMQMNSYQCQPTFSNYDHSYDHPELQPGAPVWQCGHFLRFG